MAIAFGYVDLQHVFKQRVGDMDNGIQVIREANARTLAFHNAQANAFLGDLSQPVQQAKERYMMSSGGSFQPMDADGNPLPTLAVEAYDIAYPIRGGGDAVGTNRVSRAMMTVEDFNNAAQDARLKDKNFLVDHMLAAILTSTSYVYIDETREGYTGVGEVNVMPLANGDTTRYVVGRGRGLAGNHNHYLRKPPLDPATAPGTFQDIYNTLREHVDDGSARIVVYVASTLIPTISALPGFVAVGDPDVTLGSGSNTLNASVDKGIGDEVVGKYQRCWIISMDRLPDNYMIGHIKGQQPLGQRQFPVASLQGLFTEEHNVEGNHYETRYLRFTGFGVRNRTAACAVFLAAAGNYVTPAEYTAPLAV